MKWVGEKPWEGDINTEDELNSVKIWSAPIDKGDHWEQYYSRVGELSVRGIILAGQYFDMNVPLDSDYQIGRNWSECH